MGTRFGAFTTSDWSGDGVHDLGGGGTLTAATHQGADGSSRQLLEVVDASGADTYTIRVFAASLPSADRLKQTLWVDAWGIRADGKDVAAGTPGLVRMILQTADVRDGDVPVTDAPRIIDAARVSELRGHIIDTHRDISVVLAAPLPGAPLATWQSVVTQLTRDSVGQVACFVLTEDALSLLNAQLPVGHQVGPASVRTFLPDVRLDDPADGLRHRVLSPSTLAQAIGSRGRVASHLISVHATIIRRRMAQTPLPHELARVEQLLERKRLELIAESVVMRRSAERAEAKQETALSTPPPVAGRTSSTGVPASDAAETSWSSRARERLRALVARVVQRDLSDEDGLAALEEKVDQLSDALAESNRQTTELFEQNIALEGQMADLRAQIDDEQLENAVWAAELRESQRVVRSLTTRLRELNDYATLIDSGDPLEAAPGSVVELVERLMANSGVYTAITDTIVFTRDAKRALDDAERIDKTDSTGRYADAFWDYVLELYAYAGARRSGFQGSVHTYLKDGLVGGHRCPDTRHKAKESQTVGQSPKMRGERTLAVPPEVSPSGTVYMEAHFAPTHRDMVAPRMHYYDDMSNTGRVYIGYIGPHLTNTKTN